VELNWSTFVLEIFNFLILVWLLSRFLYRPVMNVINNRRQEIRKKLDDAESIRNNAEALKSGYEDRLSELDREKALAMKQLEDEIAKERLRRLEQLRHELDQEKEKAGILNQRQMQDEKRNMERQSLQQGAAFCSRILTRLAGPALETGLINILLDDLDTISPEKQKLLITGYKKNNNGVTITSAFTISEEIKQKIEEKLQLIIAKDIVCTYELDTELIAGLRIRIGSWLLQTNLQDELKYFAETDHGIE